MKIKDLFKFYNERYFIQIPDLADSGETNRIHLLVTAPILFAFGFIDIIIILIMYRKNISESLTSIIYFGIFTISSLISFLLTLKSKNAEREKSYIKKTIPFFIIFYTVMFASLYNFFILKQPFNGFLAYCLTGFISLCAFSFSPLFFLAGLLIVMAIMTPGIYSNFGATGLLDSILTGILMFFLSLYKRRTEKNYIQMIKKQKNNLEARTFGNFTLFYDGKVVKFSRTKSNELLGYLIYKNGSSVKTKELITVLWGDKADSARYGNSLRNLIIDIKHTLLKLEIQNFFITEYNNFRINPEALKCDYYDFLKGDSKTIKQYAGEFMNQYSWAEAEAIFLEKKALKK